VGSRPPAAKRALPVIGAGRVIAGKFRLTHELGQGGMGLVWAAVHETLGREVAVKFLQPQTAQNPVLADRFVSEAHMVASIKHRFVVDVFDFGVTDDGLHYMVLELLHGRSLADRMDHGPAIPVRTGVRLIADCLRGLHAVHEAGIIHRDLKPDNIFVIEDADGAFPKLIDFGISRRTAPGPKLDPDDRKSRLTQPGTVLGTPYYMSPEQLRAKHNIDRRADIYSTGVMLYELLIGRLPFSQDNLGDLMVAITVTGAPSFAQARPELGPELAAIIHRALSAAPDKRYASALELREALLQVMAGLPRDAFCAVQLKNPGEFTLSESTSLPRGAHAELSLPPSAASELPFPMPAPRPVSELPIRRPVSRHVWLALASAVTVAWLAWTLVRELAPAPEASLELGSHTHEVQPREPARVHTAVAPAPAAASAAPEVSPVAPVGVSQPMAAPVAKPARSRTRAREQTHPSLQEHPQKLYRKLDF
jgi:serine/threonine protein kinase